METLAGAVKAVMAFVHGLAAALPGATHADAAVPVISGDLLLFAGALILVLVLWFVIRGALSITSQDKSDDDSAGVGILEGIDDDDDEKKKK